eukprot:scaffold1372_cov289-Chaetoceros_neogracile.AAC.14
MDATPGYIPPHAVAPARIWCKTKMMPSFHWMVPVGITHESNDGTGESIDCNMSGKDMSMPLVLEYGVEVDDGR